MLTRKQAHELERAHRLKLYLDKDENKTIIATYEPFAEEVADFSEHLGKADEAAKGKEVRKDVTEEKTGLKHAVAKSLSGVCRKTEAYANKYNQPSLAVAMNVSETAIFEKKDEDIQPFFEAENDLIAPLLTDVNYIKYGVTKAKMEAIGKQAADFHKLIGQPGVNEADYSVANAAVDGYLKDMAGDIEQMNLLVDEFEDDYPDFVRGYRDNVRLGDDVIRHNGIEGVVRMKASGGPAAGVVVMLADTEKKAVSELTGAYRLVEVKPGWYNIVVMADGKEVLRLLHRILKGRVETLDFEI